MMTNWKTTLAGVAAILTASGHLLNGVSNGDFSGLAVDGPLILGGVGLLFAKDHDVTGAPAKLF